METPVILGTLAAWLGAFWYDPRMAGIMLLCTVLAIGISGAFALLERRVTR